MHNLVVNTQIYVGYLVCCAIEGEVSLSLSFNVLHKCAYVVTFNTAVFFLRFCCLGYGCNFRVKVKPFNHTEHLKLCECFDRFESVRLTFDIRSVVCVNRCLAADCAERTAKVCHILAVSKLLSDGVFYVNCVYFTVYFINAFKACYEVTCCFFADACNAGDIVGGVAHKCFYVDKLRRSNTIFLKYSRFVIVYCLRSAHLCGCQQYVYLFVNKLKAVAVTRSDEAFIAVLTG